MNRRLISDISASTFQVILNQCLGLIVFFITSRYLAKSTYGEMNWSLAVLTFVTTILSLRLEQIVVSRVAAGQNAGKMLTLFSGHVVFAGVLFYAILFGASLIFPSFFNQHNLLLILAVSHLLSLFSSPFKQLANGKEHFRSLAIMSSVANLVRSVWLLLVIVFSTLTIQQVLIIYIVSSLIELLVCFYIGRFYLRLSFSAQYGMRDYFTLVKESLPLAGAVILNASIARIDWILLGLFTSAEKTAEYSFAYKVFELSPLPLLVVAPILLSRFSKYFSLHDEKALLQRKQDLSLLIRTEMIVAVFIPLVLNLAWTPLIDSLTANKYGSVNELTFFILSCCIPFLYINNLLWTVHFAQNRLRLVLRITMITFLIILAGDSIFIPLFDVKGAAVVYLSATVIEYINYMRSSILARVNETWSSLVSCLMAAGGSGFAAWLLSDSILIRLLVAIPLFCLLLVATKQLRKSDLAYIQHFFGKKKTAPAV